MNYISIKHLKALGACEDQTQKFQEVFGSSVKFESLEEAQELALKYAQEFDFKWIGWSVFGKAYEEAEAPILKAYQEAEATLWKAYEEAKAPLLKAYLEARVHIQKAYEEAKAPLLKDYQDGRAKIFAKMWWEAGETDQKLKEALGEPE